MFRKTTVFQRLTLIKCYKSYRALTTSLIHFKPMFHIYTPYIPCKNQKTFQISNAFFGWVGGRYGNETQA